MSKKTPQKSSLNTSSAGFSPIIIHTSPAAQSQQRNLTGPPRVIRDIIADLYNNIQKWNSFHIKGCGLVKQIASYKTDQDERYSPQLEEYCNELYVIVQGLKTVVEMFNLLVSHSAAFAKLPNVDDPVFFSLSSTQMSVLIEAICFAYNKEFQVKQSILENIPHARTKNAGLFLATYWTHQLNITDDITFKLESLLVESGHRPIQ